MIGVVLLFLIVAIILWLRFDYTQGLKKQRGKAVRRNQPIRHGTVRLLPTGDEFIGSLIHDIKAAEHHIHILFYIFRDDHIGKKILQHLEQKAKEGVAVRLLVDRFGADVKNRSIQSLKQAGAQFEYAHRISFPYWFFSLIRRNHRKITVIDGKIGYIGGYNIGDEYLGRDPKFGFWRDYHLRLTGDGVQDLQDQFIQDWERESRLPVTRDRWLYPPLAKGPHELRIIPTNGSFLEDSFLQLVEQAEETITIGTPYFIPGEKLHHALLDAAARGVAVRLLVPKKGDHPLVKEAAFPYFKELLEGGINIYRYYRGFFHGKAIVIDDKLADVGTANFDKRSFRLNYEINCLLYDKEMIQLVREELDYDFSISERLQMEDLANRSFFHRTKEQVATLFSGFF